MQLPRPRFRLASILAMAIPALLGCQSLPSQPFQSQAFRQWGVSCSIDEKDNIAACRIINQRSSRTEARNYLEVKATKTIAGIFHSMQPAIQGYWYRYQGPYADVVEVLSFRWGEKIDNAFLQVDQYPPLELAARTTGSSDRDRLLEQLLVGKTVRMWGTRANGEKLEAELPLDGFADAYRAGKAWLLSG